MSDTIQIKFVRNYNQYNAEETATFRKDVAEGIVSRGYATRVLHAELNRPKAGSPVEAKVQAKDNSGEKTAETEIKPRVRVRKEEEVKTETKVDGSDSE